MTNPISHRVAAHGAKRTLAEIVMCARQSGNNSLIKPQ